MKALTHDVLYETYRTEKLSRTVHSDTQYVVLASTSELHSRRRCLRDSSILPEELATQSVRLKEEQLRREEEKVCLCCHSRNHKLRKLMRLTAPRDRAQGAEGDQREEAGAVGEGGEPAEPRESSGGAGIAGRVWPGVGVRRIVGGFMVCFAEKSALPISQPVRIIYPRPPPSLVFSYYSLYTYTHAVFEFYGAG